MNGCGESFYNEDIFKVGENYEFSPSLFKVSEHLISRPYKVRVEKMDYLLREEEFNSWFSISEVRNETLEKLLTE